MIDVDYKMMLCECQGEAILCQKLEDDSEFLYFSIYTSGQYNKKPNLVERIKYGFYHIFTGKKYEDQVILSKKQANDLANWILK